jgi:hypothetical protein
MKKKAYSQSSEKPWKTWKEIANIDALSTRKYLLCYKTCLDRIQKFCPLDSSALRLQSQSPTPMISILTPIRTIAIEELPFPDKSIALL